MDRAYIDKHHLIDLYAQGRLGSNQLDEFEIYMLEHPEIVDEIEIAKGMQAAIGENTDSLSPDTTSAFSPKGNKRLIFARGYAIAATALLGMSAVYSTMLSIQVEELQSTVADLREPSLIAEELWFEPVRGEHAPAVRQIAGEATVIHIDVSSADAAHYVVELSNDTSGYRWRQSQVQADDEQLIRLVLPSLPPGNYSLSVASDSGSDNAEPFVRYRFSAQVPTE